MKNEEFERRRMGAFVLLESFGSLVSISRGFFNFPSMSSIPIFDFVLYPDLNPRPIKVSIMSF